MTRDFQTAARFDLHVHTDHSDGRYQPGEVLERCAARELEVVALTDHDLVTPVPPGLHQVGGRQVHVLCGAEISGVHEGRELHLLVYFSGEAPPRFQRFCDQLVRARHERYRVGAESLSLPGVSTPEPARDRSLTRHHLARALVRAGHASSVRDAFDRLLGHDRVPRVGLSFVEAIRQARAAGGLTSWAHPPVDEAERHLSTFVAVGLQGIETRRPRQKGRTGRSLRRLARRHGLFVTGGSDWHGWRDEELGLFAVRGQELRVFLEALQKAA